MSSPTAHRDKRQFQPSITSFFARDDKWDVNVGVNTGAHADSAPFSHDYSRDHGHGHGLGPATTLPDTIQSSLLNVGMRIRKSVPEGYKTHKTIPTPQHTSATAAPTSSIVSTTVQPIPITKPMAASRPAELTPFCGLHKIGGYANQPVNAYNIGGETPFFQMGTDGYDGVLSSQESYASTVSNESTITPSAAVLGAGKRRFEDDEDEDAEGGFPPDAVWGGLIDDDISVSPKTLVPVGGMGRMGGTGHAGGRDIKMPRSRRGHNGPGANESGAGMDVYADQELDFGEAEFLIPSEEVEMSGV